MAEIAAKNIRMITLPNIHIRPLYQSLDQYRTIQMLLISKKFLRLPATFQKTANSREISCYSPFIYAKNMNFLKLAA